MAISTITKVGKHLHSIFKCDPRSQQEGVDGGDSDADFVAAPNENPRSQQEGVEGGDSDADFVAALNENGRNKQATLQTTKRCQKRPRELDLRPILHLTEVIFLHQRKHEGIQGGMIWRKRQF